MATISELKLTLTKIGRSSDEIVKIKVNNVINKLLEKLEEELYTEVLVREKDEVTIKIRPCTKSFSLQTTINARRNELTQWATFFLPTVGGSLIMFTRMGVKTHHEAMQCGIGGQIIGLVF